MISAALGYGAVLKTHLSLIMSSDSAEFERMLRQHAKVIASAVRRVCKRRYQALVPDVTQEVYLKLWKLVESGKELTNPSSYVYRVALTTGLDAVKQAQKQSTIVRHLEHENASKEERGARAVRARLVEQLLEQLEPESSEALRAYLAGYNHVEIATLFGWTESVARHRVYRGIGRLRAFMQEHERLDRVAERE